MKYAQTFTLPDGFEVTLSYQDGEIAWHWSGPPPASLTMEKRRRIEACYLHAKAVFLRDLAAVLEASQEPVQ